MAKLTSTWYINNNDLLGCYERYKSTYKNWKDHWWNTLETIYNNSKEWAEKYILDNVNRILVVVKKTVEKVTTFTNKVLKDDKINLCYWVRLIEETGSILYNKIGTTSDSIHNRMSQILKKQYKDGYGEIVKYEILGFWNCGTNAPEGLESYLRSMLIKKYNSQNYVKNDRFFIGANFKEPTFEEMNNWAKEYLENA